ncbi:hypothetical protein Q3G72_018033 [Acer saccharum]|nr:hypothetical protein Q3G72_018033 [Acer saccharum]
MTTTSTRSDDDDQKRGTDGFDLGLVVNIEKNIFIIWVAKLKESKGEEGGEDDGREPDGGTPPDLPVKRGIYHFFGFLQIYAPTIWKKKPPPLIESMLRLEMPP